MNWPLTSADFYGDEDAFDDAPDIERVPLRRVGTCYECFAATIDGHCATPGCPNQYEEPEDEEHDDDDENDDDS